MREISKCQTYITIRFSLAQAMDYQHTKVNVVLDESVVKHSKHQTKRLTKLGLHIRLRHLTQTFKTLPGHLESQFLVCNL